jgi:hypothetical protein
VDVTPYMPSQALDFALSTITNILKIDAKTDNTLGDQQP